MKKMKKIISKVSGREYSPQDVFDKFLLRGEIKSALLYEEIDGTSPYGDRDINVTGWVFSYPQMTDAPSLGICVNKLPLHVDYAGKVSLGHECGTNPYHRVSDDDDRDWYLWGAQFHLFEVEEMEEPVPAFSFDGEVWKMGEPEHWCSELLKIIKACLLRQAAKSI